MIIEEFRIYKKPSLWTMIMLFSEELTVNINTFLIICLN